MLISAKTDVGKVRVENQDAYRTGELPNGIAFAVVCDGMGGAAGGSVASTVASDTFAQGFVAAAEKGLPRKSLKSMLTVLCDKANSAVYTKAQADSALSGMGTTIVAAVTDGARLCTVHAGDSRAYLFADDTLTQLTKDHSVVQTLLDDGYITEEQAAHHIYKNLITRALGTEPEVPVDYNEYALNSGETVLLCTDGLTNYLTVGEIAGIIKSNSTEAAAALLVDAANDNGGGDNVTVVLIKRV
ncbi:MAG: Stp1/IreP family PP2C-type Ser/Thr phosphatase [Clostridia bacterium]|nr:Stp1/IreP family PP2C-type Ser/Thr phosphatase [Clostridia bacterium]